MPDVLDAAPNDTAPAPGPTAPAAPNTPAPADPDHFSNRIMLLWVAGAGACGGIGSAVWSQYFQVTPDISPAVFWVGSVFLGALAAVFGVFLLAKTDHTKFMHCMALAAACGFSWSPVLESSRSFIAQMDQREEDKEVDDMTDLVTRLQEQLASPDLTSEQQAAAMQQALDQAQHISGVVNDMTSTRNRQQLQEANAALIHAIGSSNAPVETRVASLASIGATSVNKDDLHTSAEALTTLSAIATESTDDKQLQTSLQGIDRIHATPALMQLPAAKRRVLLGISAVNLQQVNKQLDTKSGSSSQKQEVNKRIDSVNVKIHKIQPRTLQLRQLDGK